MPRERFKKGVGSHIIQRAMRILRGQRSIRPTGDGIWEVPSESKRSEYYGVGLASDASDPAWQVGGFTADYCACEYHRGASDEDGRGRVCKHIVALRLHEQGLRKKRGTAMSDPRPRYKNPAQYDNVKAKEKRGVRELIRAVAAELFPGEDDVIAATPREAGRAA